MNDFVTNTLKYKRLELAYDLEELKYHVIEGLPIPPRIKAPILRRVLRNLFAVHQAKRDYIKSLEF